MATLGATQHLGRLTPKQLDLMRRAITDAGFSTEQAWLTAEHFEVAARDERQA